MAEQVKEFKDLTLVFDNTIACPFTVLTDMPGGTMALRRTLTIPVTTGRIERTFPFDSVALGSALVDGKLIQFLASPTGALKIYSGFVRFRMVGEYVDGTLGEVWQTQPLSL